MLSGEPPEAGGRPERQVGGEAPRGPDAGVTRRGFLIAGGVVVAAAAALGVTGSRSWTVRDLWYRVSGAYGPSGTPPPAYPVTYREGRLPSAQLAEPAEYVIAYPPGVDASSDEALAAIPVLVCLPGRNRTPREVARGGLRLGDCVADAVQTRGVPAFVVAAVQAGDTYWHPRANGEDAMAMLSGEFIPWVRDDLGIGGPMAIMGWSMGGYGALRAAELSPQRFCAVCAVSPALWRSFDDGVGDAFDSAADYAANDVYADAGRLRGLPVRLDCGRQDPFAAAARAFVEALPEPPAGGFEPGGHNEDYWSRVAPAEIDWLGRRLDAAAP
jgi:enterochelin esterase-like enzyme